MNPKGTNRSVRRTKEKLRQALTELLQEKPLQSIKVRELADRVDINRGTFYLYYKDIYDMIDQIENEMLEAFNDIVKLRVSKNDGASPDPVLSDVFTFLANNADICIALIGPNGDLAFVNKLKELVRERCLYYWTEIYNAKSTRYFDYFYAFFIAGCVGMFEEWLKSGMQETPEEMADILDRMIMNGVKALG
ncbi:MAG: TetR/AcrR family transcriptional regulator [Christensenellaceae bacterium]|jgi:AcrR family transcriptional regulator